MARALGEQFEQSNKEVEIRLCNFGKWMREEEKRIGASERFYYRGEGVAPSPTVRLPQQCVLLTPHNPALMRQSDYDQ
jgi:hypothetical protein